MNLALLGTLLLGGIAVVDATPVAQTLVSQPLVTATVLGWLWHDWRTALEVGIVLQVLAASTLPVGARTPEDYAAGGVVGAGLALMLASGQAFEFAREGCALVGVLAGLVAATGGIPLLRWQRRRNEGLARWCEAEITRGNEGALAAAQRAGIVLAFAVGVAYTAVCLGLGVWGLAGLVGHESIRLSRAWALAQPLWLGLGLAQVLNAFVRRRLVRAAIFGAALMSAWIVLVVRSA
jgi:mannose/fructose/N-acetylgalactosamine-specific phosphotransferase system component IIC